MDQVEGLGQRRGQAGALGRRLDRVRQPAQEREPELVLEQLDVPADGAVGDAEFARRRAHAAEPCGRLEGPKRIERKPCAGHGNLPQAWVCQIS